MADDSTNIGVVSKSKNVYNVKTIPIIQKNNDCYKHHLFPSNYPNIYILAKKGTGKTTIIFNILRDIHEDTIVIFFCGNLKKDDSYMEIMKDLKKRKIRFIAETDFMKDGQDQLLDIIKYLKSQHNSELDIMDMSDEENDDKEENEQQSGTTPIYNNIMVIIDDLSKDTKFSPTIESLLKENRHIKSTIIIATQNLNDIKPECINQMQYVLAFAQIPDDGRKGKLFELYTRLSLGIPFDKFKAFYYDATKPDKIGEKSRNFLYIDVDNNKFGKNFNVEYRT